MSAIDMGYSPVINKKEIHAPSLSSTDPMKFLITCVTFFFVGILAVERKTPSPTNPWGSSHRDPLLQMLMPTSSTAPASENKATSHLGVLGTTGTLGRTDTESVPESAVDLLEVSHSAGAGGPPTLGLLAPVVCFSKLQ